MMSPSTSLRTALIAVSRAEAALSAAYVASEDADLDAAIERALDKTYDLGGLVERIIVGHFPTP